MKDVKEVGLWHIKKIMNINFDKPTQFWHHRDGWKSATQALTSIHDPNGIKLYDWADRIFKDNTTINHPWCGFLHNVLTYPKEYPEKYTKRIFPLSELVKKDFFQNSIKNCFGLYTLSRHTAEFLKRTTDANIISFTHPTQTDNPQFSWEKYNKLKKVVTIGQWLRKYHSIYKIESKNHKKILLKINAFENDYKEMKNYTSNKNDVIILPYLCNHDYDELLSNSIVFLDLYDCAACNVIIECISRNTPILINILPGIVEYLGPNYPLYYETLEQASIKLQNEETILNAHLYLKKINKNKFNSNYFLSEFLSKI